MFVTYILSQIRAYLRYRETARELSQLDDRELGDLGIVRSTSTPSRALRLLQSNPLQLRMEMLNPPSAGFCVFGICGESSRTVRLCSSKIVPAHFVAQARLTPQPLGGTR